MVEGLFAEAKSGVWPLIAGAYPNRKCTVMHKIAVHDALLIEMEDNQVCYKGQ
ncbi:hypothetical protein JOC33_003833 [Thalassobacillus pellis]|nr:hypothetical protein [Thalassobacillus pellis]